MSNVPIAEHALLSDCGSAALVTSAGSVDWLCLPRFDSPPVLGRLLDEEAGHFLVAPASAAYTASWRYRPSSLVLETTWSSSDGELIVTDALALGPHEKGHDLGQAAPGILLRSARCTRGAVSVRVEFAPRPEFGLIHPRLTAALGAVIADGGASVLVLSTDMPLECAESQAMGTIGLEAGDEVSFALEQHDAWAPAPPRWKARQIRSRLTQTESSWRSWSALHQRYEGPLRELVHRSGLVLQGLTYARSGAIVAAATTSLPEGVGSGRTWDYRFTWVRDASMTLQGLYVAACPDEAGRFFAFLARSAATQLERGLHLQIMYGIGGERDLTEREVPHLSGWRNTPPVRVGNGAWTQRQLDVYGSLMDAAYTLREQLGPLDAPTRTFLRAVVTAAVKLWPEDDQGIWEIRGPARPFLHSKLMCWVALDRGLKMADQLHLEQSEMDVWVRTRDDIAEAIATRGWSDQVGAYTQSFGSDELDASVLLLVIAGIFPVDDPRVLSTIDAIEAALSDENGLLYRYLSSDGLDKKEGTFLLCTFWLAHALALTGQIERARHTLIRASRYATDLGLLAEEVDPATGELLGNFPQAFSHLGLVNAAEALATAERQRAATTPDTRR